MNGFFATSNVAVAEEYSGMTGVETRSDARDSLFLLAEIRVEHDPTGHRVRVRNLSDGGMMGEGALRVQRGNRIAITMRNVGSFKGSVAWVQDDRFGVAFDEDIDSQAARRPEPEPAEHGPADGSRTSMHRAPSPPDARNMRKL